ncbi:MAG TPA: family 1 glycosylhydrolase [Candidatus Limnocylindrales bacterium]
MRPHEFATPGFDAPFAFALGIEDTFIPQVAATSGRTLDEYVLTQHDRFWRDDLARIADLGVRYLRYGIPWYRVNPAPGRFDWSWTDEAIPELGRLGIHPILDLVHYGAPLWLEDTFLSPSYPDRVAEYAAAVAERYGHLVRFWTPLNEARVHAHFAGSTGAWPPYRRGTRGYAQVMVALARGMSRTIAAIRRVRADAVIVHVDALSYGHTADPALQPAVDRNRYQGFIAQELVEGLIGPDNPTWSWLLANGVQQSHLKELRGAPARIDVFGGNFYTQMSGFEITGTPEHPVHHHRLATAAVLGAALREAHERTGRPVMLTETSLVGTVAARRRWLEASVDVVRSLREDGVPVIGYTWFPAFSLVTWAYRRGRRPMEAYLTHMGLWNLRGDGNGTLVREPTGLEARYAELAQSGAAAVGGDRLPVGRDTDADYDQEEPAREIA